MTGWPAVSSSSTPVQRKAQPWITARGKANKTAPKQPHMQLQNRFAPLLKDPGSSSDDLDNLSTSQRRVRSESKSEDRRLQAKLMTRPHTLIVGNMYSKNTKVLCFPNDMVCDMTDRVLSIVATNPTVEHIVLHTGASDIVKRQSEALKRL